MIDFINNLPMAKFVILCVSILVIAIPTIFLFGGELLQIAKEKMRKKVDDKESDSSKLDFIKELLETKNDALAERIDRTEKSIERIESSVVGLMQKMDDGFRSVHSRLDNHLESHRSIQSEPYTGQECRGGFR